MDSARNPGGASGRSWVGWQEPRSRGNLDTMWSSSASAWCLGLALVAGAGCDDLRGFAGAEAPLARVEVVVSGQLEALRPPGTLGETPRLRVALVWGAQWLPEPLCFLPAESTEARAVQLAGCRDSFGFVPALVGASAPVVEGRASIALRSLPPGDVLVGGVTARVAYASVVVFDDRDGDGTLELGRALLEDSNEIDVTEPTPGDTRRDIVYGASFVTMTAPDQRLAFREGGFDVNAAFYPRRGCGAPPRGFSVLGAGGFSEAEVLAAALAGMLPAQDPATCSEVPLDAALLKLELRAPAELAAVACQEDEPTGFQTYHEPEDAPLDKLDQRTWACVTVRGTGTDGIPAQHELVVADPPGACRGVTHYALRACDGAPTCERPEWDRTLTPPAGWPCPP